MAQYLIGMSKKWLELRSATKPPVKRVWKAKKLPAFTEFTGGRTRGVVAARSALAYNVVVPMGSVMLVPKKVADALIAGRKVWKGAL